MLRTVEATIDKNGKVKLAEPVALRGKTRALVTILDDDGTDTGDGNDAALLAESALAKDWLGADEDRAWQHLNDLPDLDAGSKRRKSRK